MTYYFDKVYIKDKFSLLASDKYKPIVKENVDYFKNDYYMREKTAVLEKLEVIIKHISELSTLYK